MSSNEVVNTEEDHKHSDNANPDLRRWRNLKETEEQVRNKKQAKPEREQIAGKGKHGLGRVAHDVSIRFCCEGVRQVSDWTGPSGVRSVVELTGSTWPGE